MFSSCLIITWFIPIHFVCAWASPWVSAALVGHCPSNSRAAGRLARVLLMPARHRFVLFCALSYCPCLISCLVFLMLYFLLPVSCFLFLFPVSYFPFPISDFPFPIFYFWFPIFYFIFLISCFFYLIPISYFLCLLSYFLFPFSCFFLFLISYFLFLISYFVFPISCFWFLISYSIFLISYFLFLIFLFRLVWNSCFLFLISFSYLLFFISFVFSWFSIKGLFWLSEGFDLWRTKQEGGTAALAGGFWIWIKVLLRYSQGALIRFQGWAGRCYKFLIGLPFMEGGLPFMEMFDQNLRNCK